MGFIPREVKFFDLLEQQSNTVVQGAKLLQECLESKGSIDDMYLASKRIHDVEHEGDELVHRLMERLNKSFITPLDREDIHELTSRLDDVLDYVDAVAKRLVTFKISAPTHHAIELRPDHRARRRGNRDRRSRCSATCPRPRRSSGSARRSTSSKTTPTR